MQIIAPRHTFDAIVVGSGASGGWAAKRMSEAGMRVALVCAGRPLKDGDYREHVPAVRAEVPRPRQRSHPAHAARAEGLLRLHRVQRRLVLQRHRRAVHHRGGQAVLWQGRMRVTGGRTNVWGRHSYRFSQQDLKGVFLRRRRRRLAARLQGPRALLRAGRGLRRHLRHGRERPRAARQQVPSVDAAHLRRDAGPRTRIKTKFGRTLTMGRARQHHQADQRTRALPLLRPLRARLRHAFLFQLRLHHRRRRAQDRQLHAHPERHGLPGADGQGDQQGARRHLRRSHHARDARDPRRAWCCARRRSSRRASCSIRRRADPTASAIRAACSANT